MAALPEGALLIDAGDLWFPVVVIGNVHVFPGIPELLQKKFESIRMRFQGVPFVLRRVYVRSSESDIADELNTLLETYPQLMLGSYPRIRETDYRVLLTLESRDADYVKRALDSLLERLPADAIHRARRMRRSASAAGRVPATARRPAEGTRARSPVPGSSGSAASRAARCRSIAACPSAGSTICSARRTRS
jgi:hypothetical protein